MGFAMTEVAGYLDVCGKARETELEVIRLEALREESMTDRRKTIAAFS